MFVQQLVQTNSKNLHYWRFVRGTHQSPFDSLYDGPITAESESTSWWHHILPNSLQWHHKEHHSVSNHQLPMFYSVVYSGADLKKKNPPKLRVTGLCAGNSPMISEFLARRASNAESISIWWRHHILHTLSEDMVRGRDHRLLLTQ